MRDRKAQRRMRRGEISKAELLYERSLQQKEEMLDKHDYCGVKDITPYQAVKNIIRAEASLPRQYPVMG